MGTSRFAGHRIRTLAVVSSVLVIAVLAGMAIRARKVTETVWTPTLETVSRRDLSQTVEASGTIEPLEIVEIKSKASGEILRMPVEVGSQVTRDQLLARIDPTTARNAYAEAAAAQVAAQASLTVTRSALARADTLVARQLIASVEHETAALAEANARSGLARTRSALENARIALEDTQVRAPISGTVISQSVTQGQVIASATGNATGGTPLLRMADLTHVQLRAWVSETDIGQVKPGQKVTVTVDAYPTRTFEGTVLKIEPMAVVQQAVTMFSVLVSLPNADRSLLPGMNGQAVIAIKDRREILAVPMDAVRSRREVVALAGTLGLPAESLQTRPAARVAAAGTSVSGSAPSETVVLVQTPSGLSVRRVTLGANDYDYYEVISGLNAGDRVVLLGVVQAAAKRTSDQVQIRQRMSGMTGAIGGTAKQPASGATTKSNPAPPGGP